MAFANLNRRLKALVGIFKEANFSTTFRLFSAVIVKNLRDLKVKMVVKHRHGPIEVEVEKNDVIVLCLFRDGLLHLPHFFAHHRKMGVTHFVFLDNGSVDQSAEFIKAQPDATLYYSPLPFGQYKECFRRFLANRYSKGGWVLLLDIDECFDFPMSHRISLKQLIGYLEETECNVVVTQMLDLFSDRPILDPPNDDGNLPAFYKYYDLGHLIKKHYTHQFGRTNKLTDERIEMLAGGVRNRFFGDQILLTKHSLFRLKDGIGGPNNGHDVTYSTVADFTAVLHHYKFCSDFSKVLKRAMTEKGYFEGSSFYTKMEAQLSKEPELSLFTKDSRELKSAEELIEPGFLRASSRFLNWVDREESRNPSANENGQG